MSFQRWTMIDLDFSQYKDIIGPVFTGQVSEIKIIFNSMALWPDFHRQGFDSSTVRNDLYLFKPF